MKKILLGIAAVIAISMVSCEAFDDGTVSAYDYGGYAPDFYYSPGFYNSYPYYTSWNNPWNYYPRPPRPVPPAIVNPPQAPSVPSRPNGGLPPSNPQAPSFNGQRPGANSSGNGSSIVPSSNIFQGQNQNWTTMPSNNTTTNGRRPGAR